MVVFLCLLSQNTIISIPIKKIFFFVSFPFGLIKKVKIKQALVGYRWESFFFCFTTLKLSTLKDTACFSGIGGILYINVLHHHLSNEYELL